MLRFRRHPIRLITVDFTGTMMRFKTSIADIYGNASKELDMPIPPPATIGEAFSKAYRATDAEHPCLGGRDMTSQAWWDLCIRRTYAHVSGSTGLSFAERDLARLSDHLYTLFETDAVYTRYEDALSFVSWAHARGVPVGVVSNADERYRDAVLPVLGFAPFVGFTTLSKTSGAAKPAAKIFKDALDEGARVLAARAHSSGSDFARDVHQDAPTTTTTKFIIKPSEVLHVGDSFEADYLGIRRFGGHGALLHRGCDKTKAKWQRLGAPPEDIYVDFDALKTEFTEFAEIH